MNPLRLLDTDTLSLYERGHPLVMSDVVALPLSQVAVAAVTAEEQMVGRLAFLRRARSDTELAYAYQQLTNALRVLSGFHISTFSASAIARYNSLLAMKLNVGKMDLRKMDLRIAAIALDVGAAVVTRNLCDFGRMPGLACENRAD